MQELRQHQVDAVESVINALRNNKRRILVVMPLGSGKVGVVERIIENVVNSETTVLVVAKTRAPLEQARERISRSNPASTADQIRFSTTSALNIRRGESPKISIRNTDVVIYLDSTLPSEADESSAAETSLEPAKAVIAFSSVPTANEIAFYGEPVYALSTASAILHGIFSRPVFHGMPALFKDRHTTAHQVELGTRIAVEQLGEGKTVFICRDRQQLDLIFMELQRLKPPDLAISKLSNEEDRLNYDAVRSAKWIVLTAESAAGFDILDVNNLVLLRSFKKLSMLLQAARFVLRLIPTDEKRHIWDFGGNNALWAEAELAVDDLREGAVSLSKEASVELAVAQKWIRPISDGAATQDLMQRERLIHVLRGIIKSKAESRSLAIGLFGLWGSGKSTIISLLRKQLAAERDIEFIEFNAWENEHVTSMPAALADAITQQVYGRWSWIGRVWLLLKHRVLINDVLRNMALVLLLGVAMSFVPIESLDSKYSFQAFTLPSKDLRPWITGAITILFAIQLAWKSPLTQGLRSFLKHISYAEHIGLTRRLRDELTGLIEARRLRLKDLLPEKLKKAFGITPPTIKTYVVVIDDLDRCASKNVWSVVEATRLIADFKEVVLIFAVDYRLLFDAIAERFQDKSDLPGDRARLSREFLAKILQLSVQLPQPSAAIVARYISKGLFSTDRAQATLAMTQLPLSEIPPSVSYTGSAEAMDDVFSEQILSESESTLSNDIEQQDDYMISTPEQSAIFQDCASLFGITNPRSLLRLYNSMVLIKGLHPEVSDQEDEYRRHAFLMFLMEVAASEGRDTADLMSSLSQPSSGGEMKRWESVRIFANDHGLLESSQSILNLEALHRVQTTSLPAATQTS